ncbi:glycosyltransferase family 4 protein [Phenylobacterium sp.]|uniref:glycosyltransferase family 4 protein n=1 Tax=Phenylobacterium sp. TaxID=1871053 RepID=UPI002811FA56|nr:glycosyltransferase family 4 protein [Phenylobacterium sp.]
MIDTLPKGERAVLYVGSGGDGLLNETGVPRRTYWYRRTRNRALTLAAYFVSQVHLFLTLLLSRDIARDAIIYVNTLLPFGAALYGRLTGRPVIYHVHEVSVRPAPFRALLVAIARLTATRLIYVSLTHRALLPIAEARAVTVYNTIDPALAAQAAAHNYEARSGGIFTVLMLCYARDYKGVPEFLRLAATLAGRRDIRFQLVLSDADEGTPPPVVTPNVTLLPPTRNPAGYYSGASLVLNLSRPDLAVETFGLTLLEAMAFGAPVIAPPVGGPAEVVSDGQEGFLIDSRDGAALARAVERLADDEGLCRTLSRNARATAARYDRETFGRGIADVIAAARSPAGARPA